QLMTTGAAFGRSGDLFPRPFAGPHALRSSGPRGIALADGLSMDERNVRGQQQGGGPASKPEASHAAASRRERGSPVGTPNRPWATPEGWPLSVSRSHQREDAHHAAARPARSRLRPQNGGEPLRAIPAAPYRARPGR